MSESTDGVESWGEAEADRLGVDLIRCEPGRFDEGAEPGDWGGFNAGEPELGDDAVFVNEGDDIGDGAEGSEGEEVDEGGAEFGGDRVGVAVEGRDFPGELVGDTRAAEFAEWVCRVGPAGVDDGVGVGHVG